MLVFLDKELKLLQEYINEIWRLQKSKAPLREYRS